MFLITVMPFFFPSVFHKMVACVVHQEGLWKTSRGKCLRCVRKAEEKDWSGKVFCRLAFSLGALLDIKLHIWKLWLKGERLCGKHGSLSRPVLCRWYQSTFAMGVFLGLNVRERVADMSFWPYNLQKMLIRKTREAGRHWKQWTISE